MEVVDVKGWVNSLQEPVLALEGLQPEWKAHSD